MINISNNSNFYIALIETPSESFRLSNHLIIHQIPYNHASLISISLSQQKSEVRHSNSDFEKNDDAAGYFLWIKSRTSGLMKSGHRSGNRQPLSCVCKISERFQSFISWKMSVNVFSMQYSDKYDCFSFHLQTDSVIRNFYSETGSICFKPFQIFTTIQIFRILNISNRFFKLSQ